MNRIFKKGTFFLALALLLTLGMQPQKAHAQYENTYVSYNDFYENLAPYGQWIEDPKFGYVWSPNVDGSFRPYYTMGHWAMTDYGNTWLSDYPWGWACFHYGRWTYDNYYGWLWIPGNHWGPAWVSWRYTEGYFGWAPLGPGYEFTSAYGDYICPNDWWVFIPSQYVFTGNYYRYWYGPRGNTHMINNSHFMNNTYENNHITYVSGPRTKDFENATHQPVQVFKIRNSKNLNTRVHSNEIKMYRPAEIRPTSPTTGNTIIPPNVVTAPQPVRTPQSINTGQTTPPQFRNKMHNGNVKQETPGTNINKTAEPAKPAPRYDNNPYEWDVNRAQPQQQIRREPTPQYEQENYRPQPQQSRPQAQPAPQPNNNRPQPQQQPQPQRQAPQPQQQPRQAPAPQPQPAKPAGRR